MSDVFISWTLPSTDRDGATLDPADITAVVLLRNGAPIVSLDPADVDYTDVNVPFGVHEYTGRADAGMQVGDLTAVDFVEVPSGIPAPLEDFQADLI